MENNETIFKLLNTIKQTNDDVMMEKCMTILVSMVGHDTFVELMLGL